MTEMFSTKAKSFEDDLLSSDEEEPDEDGKCIYVFKMVLVS